MSMERFVEISHFYHFEWYHLRVLATVPRVYMLQNTFANTNSAGVQPLVYKAYYCQHSTSKIIFFVVFMFCDWLTLGVDICR